MKEDIFTHADMHESFANGYKEKQNELETKIRRMLEYGLKHKDTCDIMSQDSTRWVPGGKRNTDWCTCGRDDLLKTF